MLVWQLGNGDLAVPVPLFLILYLLGDFVFIKEKNDNTNNPDWLFNHLCFNVGRHSWRSFLSYRLVKGLHKRRNKMRIPLPVGYNVLIEIDGQMYSFHEETYPGEFIEDKAAGEIVISYENALNERRMTEYERDGDGNMVALTRDAIDSRVIQF